MWRAVRRPSSTEWGTIIASEAGTKGFEHSVTGNRGAAEIPLDIANIVNLL